jgi:hypothetical protein
VRVVKVVRKRIIMRIECSFGYVMRVSERVETVRGVKCRVSDSVVSVLAVCTREVTHGV